MKDLLSKVQEMYQKNFKKEINEREAYKMLHNVRYYIIEKMLSNKEDFEKYLEFAIINHDKKDSDIYKEDRKYIGKVVKTTLDTMNVSVNDYAKEMAVQPSIIRSIERGTPVSFLSLQTVLEGLGMKLLVVTEDEYLDRAVFEGEVPELPTTSGPIPPIEPEPEPTEPETPVEPEPEPEPEPTEPETPVEPEPELGILVDSMKTIEELKSKHTVLKDNIVEIVIENDDGKLLVTHEALAYLGMANTFTIFVQSDDDVVEEIKKYLSDDDSIFKDFESDVKQNGEVYDVTFNYEGQLIELFDVLTIEVEVDDSGLEKELEEFVIYDLYDKLTLKVGQTYDLVEQDVIDAFEGMDVELQDVAVETSSDVDFTTFTVSGGVKLISSEFIHPIDMDINIPTYVIKFEEFKALNPTIAVSSVPKYTDGENFIDSGNLQVEQSAVYSDGNITFSVKGIEKSLETVIEVTTDEEDVLKIWNNGRVLHERVDKFNEDMSDLGFTDIVTVIKDDGVVVIGGKWKGESIELSPRTLDLDQYIELLKSEMLNNDLTEEEVHDAWRLVPESLTYEIVKEKDFDGNDVLVVEYNFNEDNGRVTVNGYKNETGTVNEIRFKNLIDKYKDGVSIEVSRLEEWENVINTELDSVSHIDIQEPVLENGKVSITAKSKYTDLTFVAVAGLYVDSEELEDSIKGLILDDDLDTIEQGAVQILKENGMTDVEVDVSIDYDTVTVTASAVKSTVKVNIVVSNTIELPPTELELIASEFKEKGPIGRVEVEKLKSTENPITSSENVEQKLELVGDVLKITLTQGEETVEFEVDVIRSLEDALILVEDFKAKPNSDENIDELSAKLVELGYDEPEIITDEEDNISIVIKYNGESQTVQYK